jgi:competence protein ComEC
MSGVRILTFNVGHGNCHAIWSPSGKLVVVDLGTSNDFSPIKWLKSIGVTTIDLLIITHPHDDHIRGLDDLDGMTVRVLHRPKNVPADLTAELEGGLKAKWERIDGRYNSPVSDDRRFYRKDSPSFDGMSLTFFGGKSDSSNLNNYSVVTVLEYAGLKMIFPGDMECYGWTELLRREEFRNAISGANILVAPHHGREAGWCADIFEHFELHLVVVSDGSMTDTSFVSAYYDKARGAKVQSRSTEEVRERYVISTRDNGHINIRISDTPDGWSFTADIDHH